VLAKAFVSGTSVICPQCRGLVRFLSFVKRNTFCRWGETDGKLTRPNGALRFLPKRTARTTTDCCEKKHFSFYDKETHTCMMMSGCLLGIIFLFAAECLFLVYRISNFIALCGFHLHVRRRCFVGLVFRGRSVGDITAGNNHLIWIPRVELLFFDSLHRLKKKSMSRKTLISTKKHRFLLLNNSLLDTRGDKQGQNQENRGDLATHH